VTSPAVTSPTSTPDAAATRGAVILLALAGFFSGAALRICDGLLPRLAADFAITPGVAGQVVFTFAVAYGFSQLVFGPLGDRWGKARVMCISLGASALTSLVCAMAPDFDALVRLRVLWGLTAAGVIPLSIAWVGDTVPYEQRQATLARVLLGNIAGMTAGQLAGGLFADAAIGWRGAFVCLSLGYLVIATLLFARLRTIPAAPPVRGGGLLAIPAQFASVLALPWARVVLFCSLLEGTFLMGSLAFLPSYLHQRFEVSLSYAAGLVALFMLGGLLYSLSARHAVRRLGEYRMVLVGGAMLSLGFVGWYLMPVAWVAGPVALLTGFGFYLQHNTLQTHASQMAPATRGTAMALFAFCFFIGQAVGAWMAGYAFDHAGPAPLLLVPAAVLALMAWCFARALKRHAKAT
jgi:predicted MFS family arabinose efflux permease